MHWALPSAFALLILLPVLAVLSARRRRGTILYSTLAPLRGLGSSWRTTLRPLLMVLRVVCLALIVVALARPQTVLSEQRTSMEGIAMTIVLDRSSSMSEAMEFDGSALPRLEVAKRVLAEFVEGNDDDLPGRPNDLIGLVAFARYADTVCPLVHAHDALVGLSAQTELVTRRDEDGTAIGDGLALAAARLRTVEERLREREEGVTDLPDDETVDSLPAAEERETIEEGYRIKSKAIVLLTDGQNNAGRVTPQQAATLAAEWGIKIYAIGIGGERFMEFFGRRQSLGLDIDEGTLKTIAERTGGRYWRATDGESLRQIYEQIDELERTEIESVEYAQYEEAFMPFALWAGTVLGLEMFLSTTLLRRSP